MKNQISIIKAIMNKSRIIVIIIVIIVIFISVLCMKWFSDEKWEKEYVNHNTQSEMEMIIESEFSYLIDPTYWQSLNPIDAFNTDEESSEFIHDVLMTPGSLIYGPYRGEPYSRKNRMMLNIYRIDEASQKRLLSDIITDYTWENISGSDPSLVSAASMESGIGPYYVFTAMNNVAIIDIMAYDYGTVLSVLPIQVDSIDQDNDGELLYEFLSRDPGCTYRLEYMMEHNEINESQRIPFQSEDWEWFFGER